MRLQEYKGTDPGENIPRGSWDRRDDPRERNYPMERRNDPRERRNDPMERRNDPRDRRDDPRERRNDPMERRNDPRERNDPMDRRNDSGPPQDKFRNAPYAFLPYEKLHINLKMLVRAEFGLIVVGADSLISKAHAQQETAADRCAVTNKFLDEANAVLSKTCMQVGATMKVHVERSADDADDEKCLPSLKISHLVAKDKSTTSSDAILAGLKESVISAPCIAVQQALGMEVEYKRSNATDKGQKTAQVVGSLLPLVGVVALTRGAGNLVLGESLSPLHRAIYEQASAGFIVGSVLTPTELKPGESLWSKRLEQGSKAAATYATITGTSASLEDSIPDFGDDRISRLARKLSITVVSGTVGGFLDPLNESNFRGTGLNSLSTTMMFKNPDKQDDRFDNLNPQKRLGI